MGPLEILTAFFPPLSLSPAELGGHGLLWVGQAGVFRDRRVFCNRKCEFLAVDE